MAKESIQSNPFYLKPGGAKEDASPTELAPNEYTQVSGFYDAGATIRMPGKRLVKQFDQPVFQIAGFNGSVLIQHGSDLIMYPDACAVAPTPEEYSPPNPPGDNVGFIIDLPNSTIHNSGEQRLKSVTVGSYDGGSSHTFTVLHTFPESALLVNPSNVGQYNLAANAYKQLDYSQWLPDLSMTGGLFTIVVLCTFGQFEGGDLEDAAFPLGGSGFSFPGATPTDGAARHSVVLNFYGNTAGCTLYPNITAFTLPCEFPSSS